VSAVSAEDAARYFKAGWPPIPLPAGQKSPPPEGLTGRDGVDLTAEQIDALAWDGNIGVRMPLLVIGLDVDAYHGGLDTLHHLEERLGPLPKTWISHSNRDDGSGIRPYIVPAGYEWVHSLPGIEIIQRHHRYAAVAPSIHPERREYGWWNQEEEAALPAGEVPHVDDLPDLPLAWIVELSRDPSNTSTRAATQAEYDEFLAVHVTADSASYLSVITAEFRTKWKQGYSRHDTMQHCLTWAMEHARAEVLNARVALDELRALWTEAMVNEPPRRRHGIEFDAMVRHAIGKANAKTDDELHKLHDNAAGPRMNVPPTDDDQPDGGQYDDSDQPDDEADGFSFTRVDLGPYLDGTVVRVVPDLGYMTKGGALLHRGRLNGVHGESGAGKSWFVEFAVRELVQAGETVMVIDLEDTPAPMIERLRQIGVADTLIRSLVVFVSPQEVFDAANVDRLIALVEEHRAVHVFLETLGEAFSLEGLNEDRDVEVAPWLRRVCRRLIQTTEVGMTLIDHGTKSAERPLDPSGSKRKRAAITGSAWLMKAVTPYDRADGGMAVLVCAKDRHGWFKRGDEVARLIMDPPHPITGVSTLRLEPAPTPPNPFDVVVLALDTVDARSQRQVESAVRNMGVRLASTRIRELLDDAVHRGVAEETAGPNRARLFRKK
jgi:hypothetical protein